MKKSRVPVLVVGAGAAGTMLSLELARRGVGARTCDRWREPGVTSRAVSVLARTRELLERFERRRVGRVLERGIPNLIMTPHIAWAARESRQRAIDQVSANLAAFLAGDSLSRID